MKNYDDLQRFKEKTQTLDIAFKDMSGQSQEADNSQWAIIRQLASDKEPELGSGQRIDLPQPQPIRGDEFVAPAQPAPAAVTPLSSPARASILDSLAATAPVAAVIAQAPKATHVERQATTSLFPPPPAKPAATVVVEPAAAPVAPAPVVVPAPVAAPQTAAPAAPSRFGALFRSRPAEPAHISKETPLKPLLEKIALCR